MAENRDWIEEQESLLILDKTNGSGEAQRLLEHSETNRDLTAKMARYSVISKTEFNATGIDLYNDLPDMVQKAYMNVDNVARHDFMKVAIEQWQAKLASKNSKGINAIL